MIRVRGEVGVRVGLGDGFRVTVRDRVSIGAWEGLGFIFYCRNMLESKFGPSGIFDKNKTKDVRYFLKISQVTTLIPNPTILTSTGCV